MYTLLFRHKMPTAIAECRGTPGHRCFQDLWWGYILPEMLMTFSVAMLLTL